MPIIGHGIDLVEVARIERALAQHGDRFLERVFTEPERAYCTSRKRSAEHLAARFAAKEAVFKALGTGWRSGIAWTDVEVVPEPSGKPVLRLHNAAKHAADELGITDWLISLTHTKSHAMASAIAQTTTPSAPHASP